MPVIDVAQAGDAQTSMVGTLPITIPASAQAGDVAVLWVNANATPSLTTPSGWTLRGTEVAGGNSTTWGLTRTLTAGDPGSTVNLTFNTNVRVVAEMQVVRGHTETGLLITPLIQSSATGTFTLPTISGAPAGSIVLCSFMRRRFGIAATITVPEPYTESVETDVGTEYSSGPNCYGTSGNYVTATGGTVGGQSATSGFTSLGVNWLVVLPAASAPVEPSTGSTATGSWGFAGDGLTGEAPEIPLASGSTATGSWGFAGQDIEGRVDRTGETATGSWGFASDGVTGSAPEVPAASGATATGSWGFAGRDVTGERLARGETATGSWGFAGQDVEGRVDRTGETATGSWGFAGQDVAGERSSRGDVATGSWGFAGAGLEGRAPSLAEAQGSTATGKWGFTSELIGRVDRSGSTATGSWGFAGRSVAGERAAGGAIEHGSWGFTSELEGHVDRAGSMARGSWSFVSELRGRNQIRLVPLHSRVTGEFVSDGVTRGAFDSDGAGTAIFEDDGVSTGIFESDGVTVGTFVSDGVGVGYFAE